MLGLREARKPDEHSARQCAETIDPLLGVRDHILNVPAGDIKGDHGSALAVEMPHG